MKKIKIKKFKMIIILNNYNFQTQKINKNYKNNQQ